MELLNQLSPHRHRFRYELTHDLDQDYYEEVTYVGNKVSGIILWTDSSKTQKIREFEYSYAGNKLDTETIKQYDGAGVLKETLTLTYTYTVNRVASVDVVRS